MEQGLPEDIPTISVTGPADDMPPNGTGNGQKIIRNSSNMSAASNSENSGISEFGRKGIIKFRRILKTTEETSEGEGDTQPREADREKELHYQLNDALKDCSRQRLRALRMSLRKYSSSESRITSKELTQVFLENNIKIGSRTFQLLIDIFEDSLGVDYERLWRSIVNAHSKSGRDSVMAQNRRNDLEAHMILTEEEMDENLTSRLTIQLEGAAGQYDLQKLREAFQSRDKNKTGKLKRVDVESYLTEYNIPIYGALENCLLNRCDMDKCGLISWPELMSFLEKAHLAVTGESLEPLKPERVRGRPVATSASNASQSSLSTTKVKPGTSGTKASRRGKSAVSRCRGNTAGNAAKSKRAASAAASKQTTTKSEPSSEIQENKTTTETPSTTTSAAAAATTTTTTDKKEATRTDKQQTQKLDRIPEPLSKQLVKAAFDKVVSPSEGQKTDGSKSPALESGKKKDDPGTPVKQAHNKQQRDVIEEEPSTASTGPPTRKTPRPTSPPSKTHDVIKEQEKVATPRDQMKAPSDLAARGVKSPRDQVKSHDLAVTRSKGNIQVSKGIMEVEIRGKKHVLCTPDDFDIDKVNTDPPQERLKLEWIYGYRGNDCRSNIYVLRSGEIIYFIGTVVILYNRETHQQRHYREHTQDIKCIAVHPNGVTVATGQNGGSSTGHSDSHVRLWRSDTLQLLHILGMGTMKKTVITLSFSRAQIAAAATLNKASQNANVSQDRLCAVDSCEGHSLSVWEVSSGKLIAQSKLNLDVVCGVDFTPKDPDQVVIIGKEHLGWWRIYPETKSVTLALKADYQKFLRAKYIICLLHNEKGDLVTGDSNGTVYVWGNGGNVITNFIKHGHDGPVFSLLFVRGTLITGGRDGMVYGWTWNKNMDQTGKIQIPKPEGGVRMLQNHKDRLLIGTTTNSILTAALSATALRNPLAGIELDKTALTMGHFGDIYGLCASDDPEFTSLVFTAGHDGVLCLYDTDKRQPLWKFFLKGTKISCIDANTAEGFIAIGTKDSLILLAIEKDEESQVFLSEVCRHKVVKNKLMTIKLAPDCESFAAADIAGALYIVGLRDARPDEEGQEEVWDVLKVIQAHNGPVLGMDWSYDIWANTYLLRTSSGSYEVFIWNSETGEKITRCDEVRSIKWFTHNCQLSCDVVGIWFSKQAEEGQITSIDVNLKKTLLAMGDSLGYISLFRYPCSKKGAYSHSYHLHEHVHSLVFNKIGSRVITIGGTDSAVTQWLVQ